MRRVLLALLLLPLLAACGRGRETAAPQGSTRARPSPGTIDPADFGGPVDNAWFPLVPGSTYVYRGVKDGKPAVDTFRVTDETKVIEGVSCVAVDDRTTLAGALRERTTDWYAQDRSGTVWYFGEDTAELDAKGNVTSTEGTWQAGVDGAQAGIFMPADPHVGDSFRQEYLAGHAEDHFEVVDVAAAVKVPYGAFRSALRTKEWTPLEPGVLDAKYYVRGIGTVKEETVKGGNEHFELVRFTRG